MISEPFATGNSLIHQLDPRVRIVAATVCSFVIALSSRFSAMIAAILLSFLLIGMARLNMRELIKRVAIVNGLVFLFWLILPLTFEGDTLFQIGPFQVSREGVLLAARITLKSNAILLIFIPLVATASLVTLGHAMNRLYVPEKIVHLLLLTYRYIFVIEQEYQRLVRAAKIRGFKPKTNLYTYRTYAYLAGMLFVRASEWAERVHHAMLCRGFKGKFYSLQEFSLTRKDIIWSGFMIIAVIGLEYLEWLMKII